MPKKKVTEAVEETAQETIPVEKAPAQMPRRQGSEDLLELNDLERGVTREDSEEAKWGYLAGAVRRQQILTGIVSAGMTYTENGMPIVPIDFEGLCVKIPVREMTLIEWPEDEPIPRSVRVQIGRMLGAKVTFKTNLNDYRTLASNLLTSNNYSLSLNAATLRLVQGEYVTDVRFEFGTVPSGFSSVMKPTIRVQVLGTMSNGYQIINRADVGGQYLNEWQTAKTTWVTTVRRFNTTPLPKTGY